MRISYDDQFLFSVAMDGSLFAFKVTDKEGRGLKREKDITFSEEVLVARSDLEEKVRKVCSYRLRNVLYIACGCTCVTSVHAAEALG